MGHPEGARATCDGRVVFDCRARLGFQGSKISSDDGLLLFRELDEVLGLHDIASSLLKDTRKGQYWLQTDRLAITLHAKSGTINSVSPNQR